MKQLIIVGAGDSGQEIFAWASPHFMAMGLDFKGYLDDTNPDAFSTIIDYTPTSEDVFICSIGSPAGRVKCSDLLREKGAKFINLIHPSVVMLSPLTATGVVIAPFVYIGNKVHLADDVLINVAATVGHDVVVGKGSILCAHVDLTGHVVVGAQALLGSHACVIPCKHVGDSAIVGAGSAVMRHVPANTTVVGVPAKKML